MLALHTLLFPTDLSSRAAHVFPLACSLARDHGARVIVLHVVPPPASHGEVVARRQGNGFHEQLLHELEAMRAPQENVRVEHRLEEGDAAEVILRVAEETGT